MEYTRYEGSGISTEKIDKWRAEGKKAIGIVCCHVPFELLHAADAFPVRLRATGCKNCIDAEACIGQNSCGFTKGILQHLMDGTYELDGLVTSNGCSAASGIITNWMNITKDSNKLQLMYEIAAPLMNNASSYKFFSGELDELKEELEKLTGSTVTNQKLKESVDKYNTARELVKQLYDLHKAEHPVISGTETLQITLAATEMPIEKYIEYLEAALEDTKHRKPLTGFSARVMLVGSALDDPEYVKAIEDCGCLVVADYNSFGLRFLREKLEYDEADMMAALSKYYLCRSSCPRMMDGSDTVHEYILSASKEFKADGIIIESLKHCDKWENEQYLLVDTFKEADIPSLTLGRDQQMSGAGQFGIRVEAFRELLESRA